MADDDKVPSTEIAPSIEQVPSPGTDAGDTAGSLLDAIQSAVPELRQDDDYSDTDGSRGDSPSQVARKSVRDREPELSEEPTPDELAKLSKAAQRRIKKLNSQRQKLSAEVQRLKSLEPDADMARKVTDYLRKNDIGQDDFLFGLELMAAMRRGDFVKFHTGVQPYMKLCEEYLGISLPPDLQQSVQQGHMTTQAAAMYSRERMDKAMAQNNAVRQQAALQQHQQTSAQQQLQLQREILADKVATAVNNWELKIIRSDTNYAAKKKAAVQSTMMALVQEYGPPKSPENGVQIAQEALRRVNAQYESWAGTRRQATSRVPSSTGRTAGVAPEPTSLLEAVRFAREGAPRL
jgi:hypothetical protein